MSMLNEFSALCLNGVVVSFIRSSLKYRHVFFFFFSRIYSYYFSNGAHSRVHPKSNVFCIFVLINNLNFCQAVNRILQPLRVDYSVNRINCGNFPLNFQHKIKKKNIFDRRSPSESILTFCVHVSMHKYITK